jgi:hypothetical protein
LQGEQRRDGDERQSRDDPVGKSLGRHHHPERRAAQGELLERAVGMICFEQAPQREHGREQGRHPNHPRGDRAEQRGLGPDTERKKTHHDDEEEQRHRGVTSPAHGDEEIAVHDRARCAKHAL